MTRKENFQAFAEGLKRIVNNSTYGRKHRISLFDGPMPEDKKLVPCLTGKEYDDKMKEIISDILTTPEGTLPKDDIGASTPIDVVDHVITIKPHKDTEHLMEEMRNQVAKCYAIPAKYLFNAKSSGEVEEIEPGSEEWNERMEAIANNSAKD